MFAGRILPGYPAYPDRSFNSTGGAQVSGTYRLRLHHREPFIPRHDQSHLGFGIIFSGFTPLDPPCLVVLPSNDEWAHKRGHLEKDVIFHHAWTVFCHAMLGSALSFFQFKTDTETTLSSLAIMTTADGGGPNDFSRWSPTST